MPTCQKITFKNWSPISTVTISFTTNPFFAYGTNSSSWSLDASGGAFNNTNPYNRNGGAGGTGTARLLSI
jgi:hypothetical protein